MTYIATCSIYRVSFDLIILKMWFNFSFIVLFVRQILGFSFDTDFPLVFDNPDHSDKNYFGYSVVIHQGPTKNSDTWLKVGAPKAKFNGDTTGAIYNCIFNQSRSCTKIDGVYSSTKGNKTLLGSTMDINNKKMVVCGPRHYETVLKEKWDYTTGICFWFDVTTNTSFTQYKPLWSSSTKEKRVQTPPGSKNRQAYYGMGMAGFSVHLPTDRDDELLVGAPVVYNSIGTPLIIKDNHNDIVPSVYRQARDNPIAKLFGYAVSSGYYKGKSQPLYYAASTPKGHQYKGQVLFFSFGANFARIKEKWILEGEQLGEQFGTSMFSGDINGNSYDDIIIGAPFFKKETYNEGRVYIYFGTKDSMTKLVIDGYSINGQFGSAVMILDDINSDGYKEVAVGAPYENDGGVVYIYKGTKSGVETFYCQRIEGKAISSKNPISGFGISLSKSLDMDNNEAKDFAVGAYLSGHTILLRNKPVVKIESIFTVGPNPILKEKDFTVIVCHNITSNAKIEMTIETEIQVDWILQRAVVQDGTKKNSTYHLNRRNFVDCVYFEVALIQAKLTNMEDPVPIKMLYRFLNHSQLQDPDAQGFCKTCPVLENSIKTQEKNVPFGVNCGPDGVCNAELSIINIEVLNIKNDIFILGTKENLIVNIKIENKGENAYFMELEFQYPEEAKLIGQSNCVDFIPTENVKTRKRCPVKDPLATNTTEKVSLQFDMTQVNYHYYNSDYLSISFKVYTSSKMLNDKEAQRTKTIKLDRLANVTISGLAEELFFDDSNMVINFTQKFKVEKTGISSVERAKITIKIPYMAIISGSERVFIELVDATVKLNQQSSNCNITRPMPRNLKTWDRKRYIKNGTMNFNCSMDEIACASVECRVGPFINDYELAVLKAGFIFNVSQVSELVGPIEKIHLLTSAEVKIESPKYVIGSMSDVWDTDNVFVYVPTFKLSVQFWILIAATLTGLLILCIIIIVLYKMGFFKRNKKTELERLLAQIAQDQTLLERENLTAKDCDSKSFQFMAVEELEENNLENTQVNRITQDHENPGTTEESQENDIYNANSFS